MARRRFPMAVLAVVTALAITAPAARAQPPDPLPPVGAEIPMSGLAVNTPLQLRGAFVSVDFRGGLRVKVEPDLDDPANARRLRLTGMRFTAELPGGDRQARQGGGTITIEQDDVDVDAKSLLRLTQKYPPRYEQIMVLSFTMTIDQPDRAEPLVLTTKEPATLIGQLTQFPPRGDLYRLQNPVDLVLPDDPDTTIASIQQFPVKVGGL
ncbi:hypothetical protein AB0J55_12085 [Amycolatopsis sp. NPDC049688]|uniref:hypothetical protein n=1 Tax=Amycolatopsis sp. NPDC049688 TaxID=3154733 RepID=UPI00341E8325